MSQPVKLPSGLEVQYINNSYHIVDKGWHAIGLSPDDIKKLYAEVFFSEMIPSVRSSHTVIGWETCQCDGCKIYREEATGICQHVETYLVYPTQQQVCKKCNQTL